MKKAILSLGLLALAPLSNAAVVTLGLHPDCNGNGTPAGYQGAYLLCELPLSIAPNNNMDTVVLGTESDVTFEPIIWTLPGIVVVGNGNAQNADPSTVDNTVLQIEAGAQIAGAVNSESALIISRGAQIDAQGTANDPIVFSSLDAGYTGTGEWGGLVIASFGESNDCPSGAIPGGQMGDTCTMEGVAGSAYFGSGHLPAPNTMSSGTLEYVVIAEGGHVIVDGNEINGLTLYAVNSSTTINNVHVHGNQDDGVEFFGGTAAITNMWMTCNEDDSVDWDFGYRGFLSNVSIKQGSNAGYGLELASHPTPPHNQKPRAKGTILSMSIDYIGPSGTTPASIPFDVKQGTDGSFNNVVISDDYNGGNCVSAGGAFAGGSGHWNAIKYGCGTVHGGPVSWDLPPSNSAATGFTGKSFWAEDPVSCP